ncbi:WD40 repeat domain-containing protein [Candidatus Dependentiae bacterium]|nr:WD40 repeat domain-containing protein [Candidatus Dependentiae bacterium]
MKLSTGKLSLLALIIFTLGGLTTHSMQQSPKCIDKNYMNSMLSYLRELPQDLKHYIIFLLLEKTLNYNFELCQTFSCPSQGQVRAVALSPDGQTALTGSWDGRARLWNTQTGELLKTLIIGPRDKECSMWKIPQLVDLQEEDKVFVDVVAFSPDGKTILTASDDETACLWDVSTGEKLLTLRGPGEIICYAVFSPDGTSIFTGSKEGTACLWDAITGELLMVLENKRFLLRKEIISAAFYTNVYSDKNNTILIGSLGGEVYIWDTKTGEREEIFTSKITIHSVAFGRHGTLIVTTSDTVGNYGEALCWHPELGGHEKMTGHTEVIYLAPYSPDGHTIITGSMDCTARIWDSKKGTLLKTLEHPGQVVAIAFSNDNNTIITGSDDKNARLWSRTFEKNGSWIETRKEIAEELFMELYPLVYLKDPQNIQEKTPLEETSKWNCLLF